MNLCTDVIDAEPKTGQKNALCIITPEQEYFIRGDNKEIINGYRQFLEQCAYSSHSLPKYKRLGSRLGIKAIVSLNHVV